MTIADEVRAAAAKLREDLPVSWELVEPLADLLDHIGDDLADYDADEKSVARGTVVLNGVTGEMRHDWTATLATARVILRSGT